MKQYSEEELSMLTDEAIKALFLQVRSIIIAKRKIAAKDAKENEIYFCYIVKELQNREENKAKKCK